MFTHSLRAAQLFPFQRVTTTSTTPGGELHNEVRLPTHKKPIRGLGRPLPHVRVQGTTSEHLPQHKPGKRRTRFWPVCVRRLRLARAGLRTTGSTALTRTQERARAAESRTCTSPCLAPRAKRYRASRAIPVQLLARLKPLVGDFSPWPLSRAVLLSFIGTCAFQTVSNLPVVDLQCMYGGGAVSPQINVRIEEWWPDVYFCVRRTVLRPGGLLVCVSGRPLSSWGVVQICSQRLWVLAAPF